VARIGDVNEPAEPRGDEADGTVFEFSAGAETRPAERAATPPAGGESGTRRYEARGTLGAGGMGAVERSFDRELGREVARKSLHRDAPNTRTRFLREARITGRLEHPGIVPVYDLGRDAEGHPYYTMAIVEGRTLAALLDDLRGGADEPTFATCLEIFQRACDAVAYAHSRGVIHRDLKPENIMVGEYGQVRVVDWGLAREVGQVDDVAGPEATGTDAALTLDGMVLGTPAYMPPEQADGRMAEVDERSDVYSLGAILYEITTLERPFAGDSVHAVLGAVIAGDLVPPRERTPTRAISPALEGVVLRAMQTDPAARFPDVRALQAALRHADTEDRARAEIKLERPPIDLSIHYAALLGIHRTHMLIGRSYQAAVAHLGVTPPEVNLIRIVYGGRDAGVLAEEIYRRLIWTCYDFWGGLNELERRGLLRSEGTGRERRFFATPEGTRVAEATMALDGGMYDAFVTTDLTDADWAQLVNLLERLRAGDLRNFVDPPDDL